MQHSSISYKFIRIVLERKSTTFGLLCTITTFGGHRKSSIVHNVEWTERPKSCHVCLQALSDNTLQASTHNHLHFGSVVSIMDHVRRKNSSMLAARGIVGSTPVAAFEIIVTLE